MKLQLHISRNDEMLSPEEFRPIVNGKQTCKPLGGLWTSTYMGVEFGSAWVQQLYSMDWYEPGDEMNAYYILPDQTARIYTVDCLKDMYHLYDNYSYSPEGLEDYSFRGLTAIKFIDFEKLPTEYDAVHLTADGQRVTRMPGLWGDDPDYDPTRPLSESFNAWDCESTVWLRWKFKAVAYSGPLTFKSIFDKGD